MPIAVTCPGCGTAMKVKDEFAGKKGKCPKCQGSIQIPAASGPVATVKSSPAPISPPKPAAVAAAPEKLSPAELSAKLLTAMPPAAVPAKEGLVKRLQGLFLTVVLLKLCATPACLVLVLVAGAIGLGLFGGSLGLSALSAWGLAALLILAATFLLKPLLVRKKLGKGVQLLDASKEPALFEVFSKMAAAFDLPAPSQIAIPMQLQVAASMGEGWTGAWLGRKLNLQLGLPLLAGCSVGQATSLLAHELARLGQGPRLRTVLGCHTWLTEVVHGEDAWDLWLKKVTNKPGLHAGRLVWPVRLGNMVTKVVLWPLWYLADLFAGKTVDQIEATAVKRQAAWAGSACAIGTLSHLHLLEFGWQGAVADVEFQHKERKLVDNLPKQMLANIDDLPEEVRSIMSQTPEETGPRSRFSRPTEREQIAQLSREAAQPQFVSTDLAHPLFTDFATTCRDATWQYYLARIGPKMQQRRDLIAI